MRLVIRWLIVAAALVVAAWLTPGIQVAEPNGWVAVLIMAAVLGLANAVVRPLLVLLSCPLVLLTLGVFLLVINALTFMLAAWLANMLGAGFYVADFWAALIGSIIVSIVSFVLSLLLPDEA
jgi:putative membrane protein